MDQTNPGTGLATITPSDATFFPKPFRALYVGGAGNLAVQGVDGTVGIIPSVPAGMVVPISVDRVLATGTTATGIVGFY